MPSPGKMKRSKASPLTSRAPNQEEETTAEQVHLGEELANKIEETIAMNMEDHPKLVQPKENKKFTKMLDNVNKGLVKLVLDNCSLTELNGANYAAAWFIQSKLNTEQEKKNRCTAMKRRTEPPWKKYIQKKSRERN